MAAAQTKRKAKKQYLKAMSWKFPSASSFRKNNSLIRFIKKKKKKDVKRRTTSLCKSHIGNKIPSLKRAKKKVRPNLVVLLCGKKQQLWL